jgi:hypothetical protein
MQGKWQKAYSLLGELRKLPGCDRYVNMHVVLLTVHFTHCVYLSYVVSTLCTSYSSRLQLETTLETVRITANVQSWGITFIIIHLMIVLGSTEWHSHITPYTLLYKLQTYHLPLYHCMIYIMLQRVRAVARCTELAGCH